MLLDFQTTLFLNRNTTASDTTAVPLKPLFCQKCGRKRRFSDNFHNVFLQQKSSSHFSREITIENLINILSEKAFKGTIVTWTCHNFKMEAQNNLVKLDDDKNLIFFSLYVH